MSRSTAFLGLLGGLFIFSILSWFISFNDVTKDIVYFTGLLVAISIRLFYKRKSEMND
ncbi:hypothetical protein [Fictibacillus barbaricus]|uniref:Uncharacterized protein n=1 Tax=Fictibacillus barbaricus TaxID=182136 RepID=A0ABU1U188_9BACL|nr:hypothetical protein [Fictibacillus barbaricus]MDR7073205.1 hypothetical protein [Fictibacillus barbaricus]